MDKPKTQDIVITPAKNKFSKKIYIGIALN